MSSVRADGTLHEQARIHFMRFNQDCTSLTVGTSAGYKLFSLTSVDRIDPIYSWTLDEQQVKSGPPPAKSGSSVKIVERLFSSSLIALVLENSPRKLLICHFKKGSEICNYTYGSAILSVRLNRARLVVCLQDAIFIHNIRDMKIVHTIRSTPSNVRGVCALSSGTASSAPGTSDDVAGRCSAVPSTVGSSGPTVSCENSCILAYPGSDTAGEVQLFDAINLHCLAMISAHETCLAAVAFAPSNPLMMATASEKGTVIRVFSLNFPYKEAARVFEFRRSVKRFATIHCLSFSQDSQFLALTSNTETVHIFRLQHDSDDEGGCGHPPAESATGESTFAATASAWMSSISKAVTHTASYIPSQVIADTLKQSRSFATFAIPGCTPQAAEPQVSSILTHLTPAMVANTHFGHPFWGAGNGIAIGQLGSKHRKEGNQLRVLFASTDGYLYIYNLPDCPGGECKLAKQHVINPNPDLNVRPTSPSSPSSGNHGDSSSLQAGLASDAPSSSGAAVLPIQQDHGGSEFADDVDSPPPPVRMVTDDC